MLMDRETEEIKQKLSVLDWVNLNNLSFDTLVNILGYLKIRVENSMDKDELLWLLRLLAFQYLNHKRYYLYPLCYDLYQITQNYPFLPLNIEQNIIRRENKINPCRLIEDLSI